MFNRPITIIAECGINHNGDMYTARDMIWEAKECGADVAKFQIYVPERILDMEHSIIKEHWATIKAAELSFGDACFLKGICDAIGIEFLASVFHPDRVEWTEKIGMERYKIASRSMYDEELAQAVAATGKPVIVSYGYLRGGRPAAIHEYNVHRAPVAVLYCVSEYPTPLSHLELPRHWTDPGRAFWYHGFSDHTIGITASVVAMSFGAKIIEKHFTLDRGLSGPDQVCSIEPDELQTLCSMRDDIEEILGTRKN